MIWLLISNMCLMILMLINQSRITQLEKEVKRLTALEKFIYSLMHEKKQKRVYKKKNI